MCDDKRMTRDCVYNDVLYSPLVFVIKKCLVSLGTDPFPLWAYYIVLRGGGGVYSVHELHSSSLYRALCLCVGGGLEGEF